MASTYVNNLRLNEMATGDASGTWGTTTNTNLELIGEALGYGTEAITTNADTHTSTVADGASDAARAMYVKYTGTLDSACTITIAPNTMKRVQIIENATSGSQNIIISQGSGANITIPPGDTKMVYLDGAGSGAAVVDAFASLSVVDLKVQDDLTVTDDMTVGGTLGVTGIVTLTDDLIIGDGKTIGSASDVDAMTIASNGQVTFSQTLIGTALDISGDIDVDGTANLDIVDIDGATNIAAAVTMATNNKIQFRDDAIHISSSTDGQLDLVADTEIQIAATTIDINGAINASGEIIAASLDISGDIDVDGTTNLDVVDIDGAVDMASTLTVGSLLTVNDGAVFNEGSADKDFRVESNGQTHALFVDGGLDNVGIGYSSKPTATLQGLNILTGGGNGGIQLNREVGGNPSDGETLGSYAWKGVDGANNNAAAEASIVAIAAEDHSGSTAATSMTFNTKPTGTGPGSAPTERMRIDSSGRVGIATASPASKLHIDGAEDSTGGITLTAGAQAHNWYLASDFVNVHDIGTGSASAAHTWHINGSEVVRIDASGRLLVASSTAVTGTTTAKLQINGTDNSGSTISIGRFSDNANAPVLNFIKSRNGTVGGNTIVQDGDNLGSILFGGNDGTDNVSVGAKIFGEVDGTPGSNDMPGRLTFFTTADGASSPTERMRIKSTGNLELALGTPLQATADGRAVNVSVGTSFVTILDFSTIGGTNAGTGFYLVTVVREGASVGTSITLQVGVSSSGLVIIYDTLQAVGLTAQASNAQIQVKQNSGGAVDCHATAIPMSITGNDT